MSETISIHPINGQDVVHPHYIHARAVETSVRSVVQGADDEHRLRPVEVDEHMHRPLGFVALAGEDYAGQVTVDHPKLHTDDMPYAEVKTLIVEDEHSGQGIGGLLVRAAATGALERGWTPFAWAANPAAQNAFQRAGFEPVDEPMPTESYNSHATAYVLQPESEAATELLKDET